MTSIRLPIRLMAIALMGLGLSACGATNQDIASRNAPLIEAPATAAAPVAPAALAEVTVNRIIVDVPRSLKVSEANRYFPGGDIVWREDPRGDRYAQVQAIVENAMREGVKDMQGPNAVDLYIELTRFHALTEKARYSTGGVHDIEFKLTLLDPETGTPLGASRQIDAGFKAYGGSAALAAEARGETQKVRITQQLARVIRDELTTQGGYQAASLGVMEMFN